MSSPIRLEIEDRVYIIEQLNPIKKLFCARKSAVCCFNIATGSENIIEALQRLAQDDFEYISYAILEKTSLYDKQSKKTYKIFDIDTKEISYIDTKSGDLFQIIWRVLEDILPDFFEGISGIQSEIEQHLLD